MFGADLLSLGQFHDTPGAAWRLARIPQKKVCSVLAEGLSALGEIILSQGCLALDRSVLHHTQALYCAFLSVRAVSAARAFPCTTRKAHKENVAPVLASP